MRGSRGPVVMVSGWELEGFGFEHRRLQATFDPGLPKKIQCIFYERKALIFRFYY